jgi:hypothetical protein
MLQPAPEYQSKFKLPTLGTEPANSLSDREVTSEKFARSYVPLRYQSLEHSVDVGAGDLQNLNQIFDRLVYIGRGARTLTRASVPAYHAGVRNVEVHLPMRKSPTPARLLRLFTLQILGRSRCVI